MADQFFTDAVEYVHGIASSFARTPRTAANLDGSTFQMARSGPRHVTLLEAPPEEGPVPPAISFFIESRFGLGSCMAWPLQRSLLVCQHSGRLQNTKLGGSSLSQMGPVFLWLMRGRHLLPPKTVLHKKLVGTKEKIELEFATQGFPVSLSDLHYWNVEHGFTEKKLPSGYLVDSVEQMRMADDATG
jgi:hypothetical protein